LVISHQASSLLKQKEERMKTEIEIGAAYRIRNFKYKATVIRPPAVSGRGFTCCCGIDQLNEHEIQMVDFVAPWPADPVGFEIVEFREPILGEWAISNKGVPFQRSDGLSRFISEFCDGRKRYILRPLVDQVTKAKPDCLVPGLPDESMRMADRKGNEEYGRSPVAIKNNAAVQCQDLQDKIKVLEQEQRVVREQKRTAFFEALCRSDPAKPKPKP
jgi:hypothetical protein